MIVFDELKKNDPHLRVLVLGMLAGLFVLVAGLWWVQIVSSRDYQAHLETQSFRTVRIPAVRGKILDRNGFVLAENRAVYNVSLYFEELRKPFDEAAKEKISRARAELRRQVENEEKRLHRKLSKEERKPFVLTLSQVGALKRQARYEVASKVVAQVSERLCVPLSLNPTNFEKHFDGSLALPFPIATNLDSAQIARFEEQTTSPIGVDLYIQSLRYYPQTNIAAHTIGYLKSSNDSEEGELAVFSYRLPDYRGRIGIEYAYDRELRGRAGAKTVQVNSAGYRQSENIWTPAEPGSNVFTTIDLPIQKATEKALALRVSTPSAAVVMDVNTGDILAIASKPTFNPNLFIPHISKADYERIQAMEAEKNRATHELYFPGSTFKPVIGMAALENGLDPTIKYTVQADPKRPGHGCIYLKAGGKVEDTVAPGEDYNFQKALIHSSNSYFIFYGISVAGISRIIDLGHRLHFGERIGLNTQQESAGTFPSLQDHPRWPERAIANVCIGQNPVLVTPLQMTVMTAAIANGGTVLWPRFISKIEAQDPVAVGAGMTLPAGRVRDHLGVSERSMRILKEAMYADVHSGPLGTGYRADVPGMEICAKTGTAQIQDIHGNVKDHTTWFISFAPREKPKYAVVVMVESGVSGGDTCGPVVHDIWEGIQNREARGAIPPQQLVNAK
jgi:penicillin-binding protein 2